MGIEINAEPSIKIAALSPRDTAYDPANLAGKTFSQTGVISGSYTFFGSYEYALEKNGGKKTHGNADIHFEAREEQGKIEVRIVVGKNKLIVNNLLSIAPTELANTLVQKALALGKITLPQYIQDFFQPLDMVDGDLSALIMGRHVHIAPEGKLWTPPQAMIGGRDTWHKVKNNEDIYNLILPDWLHGGLTGVILNPGIIQDGVLEGVTWKGQKIRIRSNGDISTLEGEKETKIPKEHQINLVIPDCFIGKIAFNGKSDRLPLHGHVGDISSADFCGNHYISIGVNGEIKIMLKNGQWKKCSHDEIEALGKYPAQTEIQRIKQEKRQESIRRLAEKLKAPSQLT